MSIERWSVAKKDRSENARIDAFISDVIEVCKRHGLSISHEDAHGAFEVQPFNQRDADWLMQAHDNTGDQ